MSLPGRTRIAAFVGNAVAGLSQRTGRGGGSVIGGRAILALDPGALTSLVGGRRVALVSGTNGKTTTTSLFAAAAATIGSVTTNLLGANLPPGIAAALAAGPRGGTVVLEVDEAWLEEVVSRTSPDVVLLLNLSRDQLDRNNEVRHLAARWRRTFEGRSGTLVVANADDPLVVWSAAGAPQVCWVGAGQPWTEDASGCPACGSRIIFDVGSSDVGSSDVGSSDVGSSDVGSSDVGSSDVGSSDVGSSDVGSSDVGSSDVGGWACSGCELRRPPLDVRLAGDELIIEGGWRGRLELSLPGRANRANAAMVTAAAGRLGIPPAAAVAAMAATAEVVGRYKTVQLDGVTARLLLAKNPAGWLEVLDVLAPSPAPLVVAINARIADGRDPSWLWDVPFERLADRVVIASGERGRDLAVRLHYAGVDHRLVLDPLDAIRAAGAVAVAAGLLARIDAVGNYTTFQAMRTRLSR